MPFDVTIPSHSAPVKRRREDASEAVSVLKQLETLLDSGKGWCQREYEDDDGRFCLVGGLCEVCYDHGTALSAKYYAAFGYLKQAIEDTCGKGTDMISFNDDSSFADVAAVIRLARRMAQKGASAA